MKKTLIFLIYLFFVQNFLTQAQIKELSLEDFWRRGTFRSQRIEGLRSMNDGEHYTKVDGNNIAKYQYKTGKKVGIIFSNQSFSFDEYEFSSNETKILFTTESEEIYRRSFTANYLVYDTVSKKIIPVSRNGKQQVASFSPDGKKVAFVRSNNLFIKELDSDKEIQITKDGKFNEIINGIPDWVYEEEFEFNKLYEWSPDGNFLAFVRSDESKVPLYGMPIFAGKNPTFEQSKVYPEYKTFKYPKAGECNSMVSVFVYNLKNATTKAMNIGEETDIYIPRIRWTTTEKNLSIFRLNRLQNKLEILFANPETGETKVIYKEENKYYIDENNFDRIVFLKNNSQFIISSEKNGFLHFYLCDFEGKMTAITSGEFDVTDFCGIDEKTNTLFYLSAENSPLRRDIYSINFDGKNKKRLSTQEGNNEAQFSSNFKYFIEIFSNANTPPIYSLHDISGKMIRNLQDNEALKKLVSEYGGVNRTFFQFETSEKVKLNGYIIKPSNFDSTRKYPVLMTQYSGPNSQEVKDEWKFDWENYLAQKGYLVVCVDGRGTGARGEAFRKITYLQLGKYESIDQIETAKYLGTLKYVDASRIGIWGWSFGGFMVELCLTRGANFFKAGVAVAPVSNWRYYDNIYTERFMRTPQENAAGYDDNSPTTYAHLLKGKLLIIHGMADDNVHLQNSAEFIEALVQANKQFEMQFYTNRNHSIYDFGGYTRLHLFTRMSEFIFKNL